ncbi:Predicted oxidoreductase [Alteromonadaceae bacterium Bs31]|nr:Predicted oxidoreductase [Alteromonadaceae bacterium Bs31]
MSVSRVTMSPNGPEVSRFIAGYWRLNSWGMSTQQILAFIQQHLELGITTVDHAMVYRSEQAFGQALALQPSLRENLEIVSKCGIRPAGFGPLGAQAINHYDSSKGAIVESVDASLSNLQTEYLDLLLIHRPDFLMNPEEIAEIFLQLKQSGKVRYFGVSNFNVAQMDLLQSAVSKLIPEGLVSNQIEFSPYNLHALYDGVLEQCHRYKITPMLWSCLAGGKLLSPEDDKGELLKQNLQIVADELNIEDIEAVAYAWVMTPPHNSLPLLGTSKIANMRKAIAAEQISLSREQWYRIWEASTGHPVP